MAQWEREDETVKRSDMPVTRRRIVQDLHRLGVASGDVMIVHSSMSRIGWIPGGSVTVIDALMEAVTAEGTLVLPAMSTGNTEPSGWNFPPVPESWWAVIRDEMPPFEQEITPVRGMGRIPEIFRKYPGVVRSNHPQVSFSAWGKESKNIVSTHPLEEPFGMRSPLGKLYELDAKLLLIGVDHSSNTSLHLAEHLVEIPNQPREKQGAAVLENGKRKWKTWTQIKHDSDDFHLIGNAFEEATGYVVGKLGHADSRLHHVRTAVDFGVKWMIVNRKYE